MHRSKKESYQLWKKGFNEYTEDYKNLAKTYAEMQTGRLRLR